MPKTSNGFTLLELIVALAIASIITLAAAYSLGDLATRAQRRAESTDLLSILNTARSMAIKHQKTVTVCPINEENTCSSDWNYPIFVFLDPQRTKTIISDDQILRRTQEPRKGKLAAKTAGRNYFRFRPTGMAMEAIGSLIWCPNNRDPQFATRIVINMGGRPRAHTERTSEGLVKDSSGKPVMC